jgi:hypothetical protein
MVIQQHALQHALLRYKHLLMQVCLLVTVLDRRYSRSTRQWTLVFGSNAPNVPINFGSRRITGTSSTPGNRYSGCSVLDDSTNTAWIIGGSYTPVAVGTGTLGDAWTFSNDKFQWTWQSGAAVANVPGNYSQGRGVPISGDNSGWGARFASHWSVIQCCCGENIFATALRSCCG